MTSSVDDPLETARAFARAFSSRDGEAVLAHLRSITIERRLAPEASEAALRHIEGQRALVAAIEGLVRAGRETTHS
jgi:hypothetical protein